jgi:tetratricopeptide (TPR) repeat protein
MRRPGWAWAARVGLAVAMGSGCASSALPPSAQPVEPGPTTPPQVLHGLTVSPYSDDELVEQFEAGQRLLLDDRAAEAAEVFDRLVRFSPDGPTAAPSLFNAGLAYLVLGDRPSALTRFEEQVRRFPEAPTSRNALIRSTRLLAHLERWQELASLAERLLEREDLAVIETIEAHGARALGLVELGQLDEATRHILVARDLIEDHRLGEAGKPPIELAQVFFALGEVRRVKSEEVTFAPLPDDFSDVLERRCQGLLDAQSAYTDAMRSLDAHWSAMAGYRVGQLYQQLHRDVMEIAPPPQAKTLRQQQLFQGAMRLRYRVLLEKGLTMMEGTVALAERTGERSAWIGRAEEAKRELKLALDDEAKAMSKLPFTEAELQEALDRLKQ